MSTADSPLPLVSYIMPVYNRANVVAQAIAGVIEERRTNYPRIEIVVMDGGSTDGTVEIIQSFGDEIQVFHSGKDGGAADAFNKGVLLATGEIIRYVAGDDKILVGHTRRMVEYLIEHPEIDLLGARANSISLGENGEAACNAHYSSLNGGWMTFNEVFTWDREGVFSFIETWFFRRSIFDRVGFLDTRYRICPDVDFIFRAVNCGCKIFVHNEKIVNKFHYCDGSNLISDKYKMFLERRQVVRKNCSILYRLLFFWTFPEPLPSRLFWRIWLICIKFLQSRFPNLYANRRKLIRN